MNRQDYIDRRDEITWEYHNEDKLNLAIDRLISDILEDIIGEDEARLGISSRKLKAGENPAQIHYNNKLRQIQRNKKRELLDE